MCGMAADMIAVFCSDIDNAVNGLYDLMSSYGYYGGTMFFYGDMKGDDMQSSYNSGIGGRQLALCRRGFVHDSTEACSGCRTQL